ncbi:helix-turn-helix domain-containing protein [Allofournierella sp.]|uniref:helix-turn-helix domain-containing protein n=1 Tax=Allofournierella sp. TaxID=1940256 RepID=UPI000B3893EC|nr:AraC family transcriptional regulator [uncultured Fournierella sp.]OUN16671.1 hypothetical protein B5G38_03990 [Gemmiger sp. An87]
MNRELLQAIYDHRDICTAVERRQEERALELWEEKARLLSQEEPAERSAMLEALSQSLYDHILRVQGAAPVEFRHASREMYTRTLPQAALVGHGAEMIRQYIRRMNEDGRQDDHIRMACCYIATHLSEPFTLETVAKHVFVSKCYLCRMFRNQTGQSFSQYVTAQRLDRAEHLLRHSGLSIDRIAEQCGFGSAAYFATTFRRRNGMAPSAWRRQLRTQQKAG